MSRGRARGGAAGGRGGGADAGERDPRASAGEGSTPAWKWPSCPHIQAHQPLSRAPAGEGRTPAWTRRTLNTQACQPLSPPTHTQHTRPFFQALSLLVDRWCRARQVPSPPRRTVSHTTNPFPPAASALTAPRLPPAAPSPTQPKKAEEALARLADALLRCVSSGPYLAPIYALSMPYLAPI